ncbi:DMT family transporter [Pseudoroseomonas ludipueritiae]|uniref:DMT family transporter n=1 Tax=Pseudoroseomonas ludipueritiae TaxID=198093 RepID=A0ABR7R1Y4_9PROT|nr:DMT family transporter [Pseudoroseomonas ludipueritiae]MBC9175731.1 DMT family transporter [Pseudoroseomonas ludipueritiae]MCG7363694.1 DMT family transporter [Roseomonas sp. ACRSG]
MSAFQRLGSMPAGATGGIAMMLLGVLLFAVNDTLGKWLVGGYAVGQLLLVRSISGLCVMAPFIRRTSPEAFLRPQRPWLQLLRVVFSTLETSLFFWALIELPLAEVMTYYMAGPIYVTALSPFLLGERVGWRRWTAVAVGFGGVVLALHPSPESLSIGAACALAGSFSYACFMVATRKLAGTPGTVLMTAQLLAALLFGGVLVLAQGWTPPGAFDLMLMLFLGFGSLAGNLCVNQALRIAPASVVVPYQYTLILWGMLFGYLFFGEVIGPLTLAGAAIIIAAGLFIFLREQQLRHGDG